tara:strand:+ start:2359 stop:2661 length:303 start_codon:yes stop_codon:yes gene_type:complete
VNLLYINVFEIEELNIKNEALHTTANDIKAYLIFFNLNSLNKPHKKKGISIEKHSKIMIREFKKSTPMDKTNIIKKLINLLFLLLFLTTLIKTIVIESII